MSEIYPFRLFTAEPNIKVLKFEIDSSSMRWKRNRSFKMSKYWIYVSVKVHFGK